MSFRAVCAHNLNLEMLWSPHSPLDSTVWSHIGSSWSSALRQPGSNTGFVLDGCIAFTVACTRSATG